MSNIINREEFVKNYTLTRNEYCLLPQRLRLTYADMLYRFKVDDAKRKGVSGGFGYVHEAYSEYFKACGCVVQNFDYGNEEYEVKSVSDADFVATEKDKELVSEYEKAIAQARWEIYATLVSNALNSGLVNLKNGNVDSDLSLKGLEAVLTDDEYSCKLSDEERKEIVKKDLDTLVDSEELEMNRWISKPYIDGIQERGYTIETNRNSIIARILK